MQTLNTAYKAAHAFWDGLFGRDTATRKDCIVTDKSVRENLSEKQLDDMLASSLDASDPVAHY